MAKTVAELAKEVQFAQTDLANCMGKLMRLNAELGERVIWLAGKELATSGEVEAVAAVEEAQRSVHDSSAVLEKLHRCVAGIGKTE
jgi:hypothetical protein